MGRIQQLDASVINKIAAGEVIERPASVVKELLENSLDALSTRIELDIGNGGSDLIRVVDNGEGIHPDDFGLAVSSHATSKLKSADDLFEVATMGFRGEALASIAEISRMRIRSRQADALTGCLLEINAGVAKELAECGCPQGTQIEIRDLFLNTPVRRKFLKTAGTEFSHISEQFTRIAIANPRLQMVLRHNEKVVHNLPPTSSLMDRLQLFYGSKITDQLIPIEAENNGVRLWGFVGHPSLNKPSRKQQYFFLNGRWIQDRSLQHALTESYRGLLMVGRQPVAFLMLELAPDQVDVNVHPTKSEVRFRDSQTLYRLILSTLRSKFLSMDLDSQLDFTKAKSEEPEKVDPQRTLELRAELASWAKQELQHQVHLNPTNSFAPPTHDYENGPAPHAIDQPVAASVYRIDPATSGPMNNPPTNVLDEQRVVRQHGNVIDSDANLQSDFDNTEATTSPATHADPSRIHAIQVDNCYVVIAGEQGLTVIDQHALHERILYEQLRPRVLNGTVQSQKLLMPIVLDFNSGDASLVADNIPLFAELGFTVEEFGGNTIAVSSYPVLLGRADLTALFREMVESLDTSGKKLDRRELIDHLLHSMSCKAAIKSGQRLSDEEMTNLLELRHLVTDAHHCPHGRPTALVLSRTELDRQFGRLG